MPSQPNYEVPSSSGSGWLAGKLRELQAGIDEANRRALAGQRAAPASKSAASALTPANGIGQTRNTLVRRGGIITLNFRANVINGFGGAIANLPDGYRPQGVDDILFPGIALYQGNWVVAGYYLQGGSWNIISLTHNFNPGDIVAFNLSFPVNPPPP